MHPAVASRPAALQRPQPLPQLDPAQGSWRKLSRQEVDAAEELWEDFEEFMEPLQDKGGPRCCFRSLLGRAVAAAAAASPAAPWLGRPLPVHTSRHSPSNQALVIAARTPTPRPLLSNPAGERDQPLQSAVDRYVQSRKLSGARLQQLLSAANNVVEHEYGADLSQLSLWWFDKDEETGGSDCVLPGGMHQVGAGPVWQLGSQRLALLAGWSAGSLDRTPARPGRRLRTSWLRAEPSSSTRWAWAKGPPTARQQAAVQQSCGTLKPPGRKKVQLCPCLPLAARSSRPSARLVAWSP
jgi:hypothetical protein